MALGWRVLCSRGTDYEFKTWLTVLKMQGTGHRTAQGKSITQDVFSFNRKIRLKICGTVKELLSLPWYHKHLLSIYCVLGILGIGDSVAGEISNRQNKLVEYKI